MFIILHQFWLTENEMILHRVAIVSGDLQSRQIGPRSHVWAEPDVLDRAAYEFADVTHSHYFSWT